MAESVERTAPDPAAPASAEGYARAAIRRLARDDLAASEQVKRREPLRQLARLRVADQDVVARPDGGAGGHAERRLDLARALCRHVPQSARPHGQRKPIAPRWSRRNVPTTTAGDVAGIGHPGHFERNEGCRSQCQLVVVVKQVGRQERAACGHFGHRRVGGGADDATRATAVYQTQREPGVAQGANDVAPQTRRDRNGHALHRAPCRVRRPGEGRAIGDPRDVCLVPHHAVEAYPGGGGDDLRERQRRPRVAHRRATYTDVRAAAGPPRYVDVDHRTERSSMRACRTSERFDVFTAVDGERDRGAAGCRGRAAVERRRAQRGVRDEQVVEPLPGEPRRFVGGVAHQAAKRGATGIQDAAQHADVTHRLGRDAEASPGVAEAPKHLVHVGVDGIQVDNGRRTLGDIAQRAKDERQVHELAAGVVGVAKARHTVQSLRRLQHTSWEGPLVRIIEARTRAILLSCLLAPLAGAACSSDDPAPATEDGGTADANDASDEVTPDAEADAVQDVARDTVPDEISDVADDADVVACGNDSPEALAACVEADAWFAIVEEIAEPRPTGSAAWQRAQDRCADTLRDAGFTVELDDYGSGINVIGTLEGTARPDEIVLVSAHYDHVAASNADGVACPGADDNASGVASALELARILGTASYERTLVVACWDEEERGLVGSRSWAFREGRDDTNIVVNMNFEMVGYFTDEPNSQQFPDGFGLFFPEAEQAVAERDGRGDFLALIGNEIASPWMDAMAAWSSNTSVDHIAIAVPSDLTAAVTLGDLRRSDHSPFWDQNVPAIMITDSSEFRNPHYHCPPGLLDTPDTLSPGPAADGLRTVVAIVAETLNATTTAGEPVRPACDPVDDDCPDGTRCTYTSEAARNGIATCTPAGDAALGEVCTRPDGEVGYDTCAAGGVCVNYAVARDGENFVRVCRAWCRDDAGCAEGELCRRFDAFEPAGLCVPACDPIDGACDGDLMCAPVPRFGDIAWGYSCQHPFDGPGAGETCLGISACPTGYACAPSTATCDPVCSDDAPCPDGSVCDAYPIPMLLGGYGACVPE